MSPCTRTHRTRPTILGVIAPAWLVAIACVPRGVLAQSEKPATIAPAEPSAQGDSPAAPSEPAEPTLDELLGLPKATPRPTPAKSEGGPSPDPGVPEQSPDQARLDLERGLSSENPAALLEQTARLMSDTAQRLERGKDSGIETQRMQEDVIKKLDRIIASAQEQENSKSKQRQQQKQQQQQQQQQQQSSSQQQQRQAQSKPAGSTQGGEPNIPRVEGEGRAVRAGGAAAWGSLPARVRDALQEGVSDKFSSLYRATTADYYRRLAEDRARGTTR